MYYTHIWLREGWLNEHPNVKVKLVVIRVSQKKHADNWPIKGGPYKFCLQVGGVTEVTPNSALQENYGNEGILSNNFFSNKSGVVLQWQPKAHHNTSTHMYILHIPYIILYFCPIYCTIYIALYIAIYMYSYMWLYTAIHSYKQLYKLQQISSWPLPGGANRNSMGGLNSIPRVRPSGESWC